MMTCSSRIRNRQEGEQFAQTYRLPSSIRMQQPSSTSGVTNGFNPDTPAPMVHVSRTTTRHSPRSVACSRSHIQRAITSLVGFRGQPRRGRALRK